MEPMEYTVRMRVIPNDRGRKYDRIELEIELPVELQTWTLVPAFLYGYEISKYPGRLLTVPLRLRKNITNVRR